MATLGTMRTRIARELQINASTYSTEIDAAIFSAIEYYNDGDFWFLDATPATFLLSSTAKYSMASVLPSRSDIKAISLHLGPGKSELRYRTLDEMLAFDFSENFTGQPVYWTVQDDDTLWVYPSPNTTLTAEAFYTLRRSLTASASASAVWTTEAEEMIRLHAEVDLLENRIYDFDTAMRKRGRLNATIAKLDEKTVVRRGHRRLKPHM